MSTVHAPAALNDARPAAARVMAVAAAAIATTTRITTTTTRWGMRLGVSD